MPQRIAAAIAFVLLVFADPRDAAAPPPTPRIAWDLFAMEPLLEASEARGLFTPYAELAPLSDGSPTAPVTPEPGSSALTGLGLALLAAHTRRRERQRLGVIVRRATRGPRRVASDPIGRRAR